MQTLPLGFFVLVASISYASCASVSVTTSTLPTTGTPGAVLSAEASSTKGATNTKVRVDVYYETLCPDSMNFLRFRLIPDYNAIAEHIDLHLHPFGKGEIVEYETNGIAFYCQHGSKECRGNMFQACAIDQASSNWTRILPLIDCMETNFYKRSPTIDSITKECADNNDFDYKELLACASGAHGQRLMYDIGKKTKALRPRLNFVPTVVFNNSYSDEIKWGAISGNFTELLCSTYDKINKLLCV